jgi:hypothetical protein
VEIVTIGAAVITRAIYGRVSIVIKKHPFTAALVPLLPIAHFGQKALSHHRLKAPVLRKIEEDSRPTCIPSVRTIDHPLLEQELKQLVYPHSVEGLSSEGLFGIVIGPSGTGKTALVRKMCSSDPEGVLYFEVFDPRCLAQDLGTAVGMVQQPTSPIDLLFTYLSGDSCAQYHKIPSGELIGNAICPCRTRRTSAKVHDRTPVLVIDGVDLLAKENKMLFILLFDRAKYLANSHALKIILVSSEGSVMPLFMVTPPRSRLADTVEVLDISDEEALKFVSNSVPTNSLKGLCLYVEVDSCT